MVSSDEYATAYHELLYVGAVAPSGGTDRSGAYELTGGSTRSATCESSEASGASAVRATAWANWTAPDQRAV